MSVIALVLNGVLMVMLTIALAYGVRLDRKLKAIREGQTAFARAALDMSQAVEAARDGLAELRMATDEATDLLGGRIVRAREAADRLESLIKRSEPRESPEGGLSALLAELRQSDREPAFEPRPAARPARIIRAQADEDLFEDIGGRA